MAEVRLSNLSKRFDNNPVVDRINLTAKDKEFLVLVGPSGCGKTTTLRMIAGLEDMDEGDIHIGDRLVNDIAPKDRDIAMVFQNYALYPHMNVYKNMAFGLKFRKLPKTEIDNRVRRAAEILGIEDLMFKKPRQLSGGQRQRVAMGRAIVRQPQVFLFDEPLSNLDAKLRVQMRIELKKLHERLQATVVYVTHDQVEAMTMGDRIVVMKDGIVQQVGRPLDLYNSPANRFVASFIGSPAMNFIPCRLVEEKSRYQIDTGDYRIVLPDSLSSKVSAAQGDEFVFGIRPEHFLNTLAADIEGTDLPVIKATINVIETLGKETFLDLSTGDHSLTALLDADIEAKTHQDIELVPNMDKLHLFNSESGEAIF